LENRVLTTAQTRRKEKAVNKLKLRRKKSCEDQGNQKMKKHKRTTDKSKGDI
jgi:hypothetical protein